MSALHIANCKAELTKPAFLALLAHSVYNPTPERLHTRATAYMTDSDVVAYGAHMDGLPVGLIVLRSGPQEMEILSIAVAPAARGSGVGRALVAHINATLAPCRILAETDDDAVGFYRSCGFQVESLGEKYPGVVRYRCMLACE